MASPKIVPANLSHVDRIQVRQADIDELWAASQQDAHDALRYCVRSGTYAWTGLIEGEVVCLFGVSPASIMGGVGYPWLIGSSLVEKHPVMFLRQCQPYVDYMAKTFGVLHNYVDDRNEKAIRWLRWLGFHIDEPVPYGPYRMPFRHFSMRSDDV